MNHFGHLIIDHNASLDVEIYEGNSPLPATSWGSPITDEDGLSALEPTFSNHRIINNHVPKTPKVGDRGKKRISERVTLKRVAKKDIDSMTKTKKTKEKETIKIVCNCSKSITLSHKESLRLLSLMRTKLELNFFDEEIVANA